MNPSQRARILIVDDDPEVHQATTFALESLEVAGKPMTLFHASNCDDALRVLNASYPHSDILAKGPKTTKQAWWKLW